MTPRLVRHVCSAALLVVALGASSRTASSAQQAAANDARALLDDADQHRAKREKESLEQSIDQYRRVLDLMKREHVPEIEARAELGLGLALHALGRLADAAPVLKSASEHLEALGDRAHLAEALYGYGASLVPTGDMKAAVAQLGRAVDLAGQVGDRRVEALALAELGGRGGGVIGTEAARAALDRAVAIQRERGDLGALAESLNTLGYFLRGKEKPELILPLHEEALRAAREAGDVHGIARSLSHLGYVSGNLGRPADSIRYYNEALPLFRQLGDRAMEAYTLQGLGTTVYYSGRVRESLTYRQQELAIWRALQNRSDEADALNNIGVALRSLGQREEAVGYYNQALELHQATLNRGGEAIVLNNLAGVRADLLDHQGARALYGRALEIAREVGDSATETVSRASIGNELVALGRYEEALTEYNAALELAVSKANLGNEAGVERRRAELFMLLGDRPQALACLGRVTEIAEASKRPTELAVALARTAFIKAEMGTMTDVRPLLDRALEVARTVPGEPVIEARVDNARGSVALIQGDARAALRAFEDERVARRRAKDLRGEATLLVQIGRTYALVGDRKRALNYLEQGLAQGASVGEPASESVALTALMEYWRQAGQPATAAFFGKQAVNLFQQARANLSQLDNLGLQRSYVDSRAHVYRDLADLLITMGRLPEAEQILGLIKDQEFRDFVRRDGPESDAENRTADLAPAEAEALKPYREVADRIVEIGSKRRELDAIKNRSDEENRALADAERDLAVANAAFKVALDRLAADLGRTVAAALRVAEIKEDRSLMSVLPTIGPGTVVVYAFLAPPRYHAVIVTSDTRKSVTVPIDLASFNRKVAAFREALQTPAVDPRGPAKALYQILVAPIARDLEQAHARTILWSLDGVLRYVPMAALYDGQRYLAESYQSVVITLASRVHLADGPAAGLTGLGVGVSRQIAAFSGLPSVESELRSIFREPAQNTGVLPGRVLLNDAFTNQAFRTSLSAHAPVVHIASHFQLRPGNDQDSFLLLGDGGHMTLREIDNATNLFEGVELLTLSACNTAIGTAGGDGIEIESFAMIAQQQGAKAVVSSLWPVFDASTRMLMEQLYRGRVESGLSKAEALRQAQLALLHGSGPGTPAPNPGASGPAANTRGLQVAQKAGALPPFVAPPNAPWAHPYYWAPFILIGNPR